MKRIKQLAYDFYPLLVLAGLFLLYIFLCWCHTESYCWFWPSIDTRYTKGFSQPKFDSIAIGMTTDELRKRLGEPRFGIELQNDGCEEWWYSDDGNCIVADIKWADFAWIGFYITVSNSVVIKKTRQVFYD